MNLQMLNPMRLFSKTVAGEQEEQVDLFDSFSTEPILTTTTTTTTTTVTTERPSSASSPLPSPLDQAHALAEFKETMASEWESHPKDIQDWANNDATLLRYLRATKFKSIDQARDRLVSTLNWRASYRPNDPTGLEPECACGKVYWSGFDKWGQPMVYMVINRPNTKNYDRGLRWSIFVIESAIKHMPPGVERVNIVIDNTNMSKADSTPMSITRQWIDILANHYPERLANGFMVNPSWYVSLFFKLISPFMDPDTKAKIHFATATPNPILTTTTASVKQPVVAAADPTTSNTPAAPAAEMDLVEDNDQPKKLQDGGAGGWGVWTSLYKYIDASQLDAAYGGDWFFKYDADVYWEKVVVGNK